MTLSRWDFWAIWRGVYPFCHDNFKLAEWGYFEQYAPHHNRKDYAVCKLCYEEWEREEEEEEEEGEGEDTDSEKEEIESLEVWSEIFAAYFKINMAFHRI